jgi:hypothetical protein
MVDHTKRKAEIRIIIVSVADSVAHLEKILIFFAEVR